MFSNAKQRVPLIFQEIIKNQSRRYELKSRPVVDFGEYKKLFIDMRDSLRPAAEKMLRWNVDKGNAQ